LAGKKRVCAQKPEQPKKNWGRGRKPGGEELWGERPVKPFLKRRGGASVCGRPDLLNIEGKAARKQKKRERVSRSEAPHWSNYIHPKRFVDAANEKEEENDDKGLGDSA